MILRDLSRGELLGALLLGSAAVMSARGRVSRTRRLSIGGAQLYER
jgi:hypothetical protein